MFPVSRTDDDDVVPCTCAFAKSGGTARAYNEEAFRYFLNIESKRAERSGRPLMVLLIDENVPQASGHVPMAASTADQLFAALIEGLRETDFVGWYQEHRVVGAVLMQRPDGAGADSSVHVRERIARILYARMSAELADRFQVRVFQLPSKPKGSV
jgi:hypothetical protein